MITSAQNPRLKLTRSLLGQAKTRREEQAFVAEGVRLVEEALDAGWPFRFVLHAPDLGMRAARLLQNLAERGIGLESVDAALLNSVSETETSQGILAVLEQQVLPLPPAPDLLLVLDRVRDPGNLGTLLRSAHAAGVQAVLLTPETADPFNPKVVRSGMGAHFRLPILPLDWEGVRGRLSGLTVFLAEMEQAIPCWQADLRPPLALIVGGEAEGASAEGRQLADRLICIPMPGGNESLNAAVAGSILLFEVVRQRNR
jgi:TrmH family RNA methyltransferase